MGLFGQISNDITYPLIGGGVGLLVGALVGSQTKMTQGGFIGAIGGGVGGAALGWVIAQNTSGSTPGGPGTFSVSSTTISINADGSYSPATVSLNGIGFSAGSSLIIQDENGVQVGQATSGVLGNFNNLGLGGTGGPLTFATYNPTAGSGYLVVFDTGTQKYSNKVNMTYTQGGGVYDPSISVTIQNTIVVGQQCTVNFTVSNFAGNIQTIGIDWGDGSPVSQYPFGTFTATHTYSNWISQTDQILIVGTSSTGQYNYATINVFIGGSL